MAKACQLTGKKPLVGNHVSFSNKKIKRRVYPNLKVKRFYVPELKKWVRLRVSARAVRTINKKGIYQYLKELEKKGVKVI